MHLSVFFENKVILFINVLLGLFFVLSNFESLSDITGTNTMYSFYLRFLIMFAISILLLFSIDRGNVLSLKIKGLSLTFLVSLWAIYVFCNMLLTTPYLNMGVITIFLSSYFWIFIYFYGLYVGKYNTSKSIIGVFFFILPILLYMLIFASNRRSLEFENQLASINYVMYAVLLLPWFFLVKSNVVKIFTLLLISGASFFSMKRGVSIVAVLLMLNFVYWQFLRNNKKSIFFRFILLILFLFIGVSLLFFVNEFSNGFLLQRFLNMQEDHGSGRGDIYYLVIKGFMELDFFEKLFGSGYYSVSLNNVTHSFEALSAHNDPLEILYDYGILGESIYISFFLFLIKRMCYFAKRNPDLSLSYSSSIIIFIVLSLISHLIIYPTYFVSLTLFWGVVEGMEKKGDLKKM